MNEMLKTMVQYGWGEVYRMVQGDLNLAVRPLLEASLVVEMLKRTQWIQTEDGRIVNVNRIRVRRAG